MTDTVTVYLSESDNGIDILDSDDMMERFDDMLDEDSGPVTIMEMDFRPGPTLKTLDHIAYREYFLAWLDSDSSDAVKADIPDWLYLSDDYDAQQEWAERQLS